ncbi:MAG TPA: maleylpyruvate isomerase N-terminal domain-containing protein [Candidatus Methylomirabilis sp.]|nr:maleylpyruvate isomerase N-terminal domain-containing protein [Candidatus Methylomirabilis sp.]
MAVDRSYVAQNDAARARLQALIGRLSDVQLGHPMPAGWTVASVLAHLAFWDQRVLSLLERWEGSSAAVPPTFEEQHVDWINDATKPLFLALDPRRAAELTLAIAVEVDRKVAMLSDSLLEHNAKAGMPINPVRATHRREHLDEIEHVLRS